MCALVVPSGFLNGGPYPPHAPVWAFPSPLPPPLGWVRTACSPLRLYSVGMGTAWVYRRCVCTTGLNKDVGFCDSRVDVRLPFPGAPVSFPLKHLCGVFC